MSESTRGRPMDVERDKRILQATLTMMGERGYEALSIEAVAKLAGVSKATVYRRYSNKLDLVVDAMNRGMPLPDLPNTGDPFEDFRQMVLIKRRFAMDDSSRRMMGCMMIERGRNSEVADAVLKRIVNPRRAIGRGLLERAIEQGALPSDAPLDLVLDMVFGAMMARHGRGETMEESEVERLIELVWIGAGGKR